MDASFHYKESHCANYNKVCHNPSNNIAFWTGYNCVRRKSIYTTGNKRSYANFYHQQLSKHQQKVTDLSRGENNFYTLVSQKKPQSYWRLVASQRFKCTFDFTNELQSLWFIARRNFFGPLITIFILIIHCKY